MVRVHAHAHVCASACECISARVRVCVHAGGLREALVAVWGMCGAELGLCSCPVHVCDRAPSFCVRAPRKCVRAQFMCNVCFAFVQFVILCNSFVCVCVCLCACVCVCFGFWLPSLRGTHTKTNTYHPNLAAKKGALERGGDTISRAPLRRGDLGAVTIHFKHTSTLVRGCVQILSARKILFKYRIHSQHHNTFPKCPLQFLFIFS